MSKHEKTFWNEFYIDSYIFVFFLRAGTEERNTQINITWFPSPEIDKTGGSNFFGPSKAYIKRQNIRKRSGTIFTSILRFFKLGSDSSMVRAVDSQSNAEGSKPDSGTFS